MFILQNFILIFLHTNIIIVIQARRCTSGINNFLLKMIYFNSNLKLYVLISVLNSRPCIRSAKPEVAYMTIYNVYASFSFIKYLLQSNTLVSLLLKLFPMH